MSLTWTFSLLTGLLALCAGCATLRTERAPDPERYRELAESYRRAQFLVGIGACEQALDPLRQLVGEDRDLHFASAYPLLEECHTAAGRHEEARAVYRSGRERARIHSDGEVRALVEVMEEWARHHEVFLETGQRVSPRLDVYPTAVDGEAGLRRGLVVPDSSITPRYEGEVLVQAQVDAKGRVRHAFVEETSGCPRYDRAAVRAVRQARFTPARVGERAVRSWVSVPIVF